VLVRQLYYGGRRTEDRGQICALCSVLCALNNDKRPLTGGRSKGCAVR
jgi:hypothetical protein